MVYVLCFLGGSLIIVAVAFFLARLERNRHVPDKRIIGPIISTCFYVLIGAGFIFAALMPVRANF